MAKIITLDFIKLFFRECKNKHALTLAASSSFFFLLCVIPFLYLITSGLGYIFDDPGHMQKLMKHFETIIPAEVMPAVKFLLDHVNKSLKIGHKKEHLHQIFLVLSSLGFFGSIWQAIEIITEEKAKNTFVKMFKSLGGLLISFILCAGLIVGPIFINSIKILFQKGLLKDYTFIQKLNLSALQISGINLISTIMLVLFFFIFFKYVLQKRAKFISLLMASAMFTMLVIMAKFGFLSYIVLVRENLASNFGSFYTVLLMMLWVFISILSFYLSIIFAITHSNVIRDNPNVYIDIDV